MSCQFGVQTNADRTANNSKKYLNAYVEPTSLFNMSLEPWQRLHGFCKYEHRFVPVVTLSGIYRQCDVCEIRDTVKSRHRFGIGLSMIFRTKSFVRSLRIAN